MGDPLIYGVRDVHSVKYQATAAFVVISLGAEPVISFANMVMIMR